MAKGTIFTVDDPARTTPNTKAEYISYKNDGVFDYVAPAYHVDSNGNLTSNRIRSVTNNEALTGTFGELVSAQYQDFISIKFKYPFYNTTFDLDPKIGAGTATVANGLLTVNGTAGDCTVSTKNSNRYLAGKTGFGKFTAKFNEIGTARVGLLDTNLSEGYFLKYHDGKYYFGRVTGGTEFIVSQDDWNGTVNLNNVDFTKINIFMIMYGYLGVANTQLLIKLDTWQVLHTLQTEGRLDTVSVQNPDFKITIDCKDGAIVSTGSLSAGVIDGGQAENNIAGSRSFHFDNSAGLTTLSGTDTATLGTFQNKSTYKTVDNKVKASLYLYSVTLFPPATGEGLIEFQIIKNATLSGTSNYIDVDTDNSVIAIDNVATYASGGRVIKSNALYYSTGTGNQASFSSSSSVGADQLGLFLLPNETATIVAKRIAGDGDASIYFSFNWIELF
jgi:hypothetical protein